METTREPIKERHLSFNVDAPSFVPGSRSRTSSFNNTSSNRYKSDKSNSYYSSSMNESKNKRPRSKSMQVDLEPKTKPIFRAKVSNISMKSSKTDLADFFKSHFQDVKSTDFQPRYSEHGMMFGFIVFETEESLIKSLELSGTVLNGDELKIERCNEKKGVPTSTTIIITNPPERVTLEEAQQYVNTHVVQPLFFSLYIPHETSTSSSVYLQYLNMEQAGKAYGELVNTKWGDSVVNMIYKKRDDKKEFCSLSHTVYIDPIAKELWNQLYDYKLNYYKSLHMSTPPVLIFPFDLSPFEKACVYTFTEKLSLCHAVHGIKDDKHIIVSSAPPKTSEEPIVPSRHSSIIEPLSPVPDEEECEDTDDLNKETSTTSFSTNTMNTNKKSERKQSFHSTMHASSQPFKPSQRSRAQSLPSFSSTSTTNYTVSKGPRGQEKGFTKTRQAQCPI